MAKLMVEIDLPDVSYSELEAAMKAGGKVPGADFEYPRFVVVDSILVREYHQYKSSGRYEPFYKLPLIGVRP